MNKQFKQEWIDALRSGNYKQGINVLCNDKGKYCCLGVASDLLITKGILEQSEGVFFNPDDTDDESDLELPEIAVKYMEVSSTDPAIQVSNELLKVRPTESLKYDTEHLFGDYTWTTLAAINDAGYTFEEIANIIEEQL